MKRFAVVVAILAGTLISASPAHAVDGFSQPTYSPNSDPQIHQTEACTPPGPIGAPCMRWVRQGGRFMQGPYSQAQHEQALVYQYCTYTQSNGSGGYYWAWVDQTGFCTYAGTGHGGPWAVDK